MPYTTVVAGTAITASWGNANVRDQTIVPFANVSARDSAITSPVTGQVAVTTDTMSVWLRKSGAWRSFRSAPDLYKCHLTMTAGTSIGVGGWTPLTWDNEIADPSGWHAASSAQIKPTIAGQLYFAWTANLGAIGSWATGMVIKNGTTSATLPRMAMSQNPGVIGGDWGLGNFGTCAVNGSTDYINVIMSHGSGSPQATATDSAFFIAWMESWT